MRVIAGTARGRRLVAPKGRQVRPTSDRVREALFASLGERVVSAVVLDLFAGSGALAIEALSRGAARAVLVERDPKAAAVIAENLDRTGFAGRARLVRADAARFCRASGEAFDLVLVDAPYGYPTPTVYGLLDDLAHGDRLAAEAVVVVERDRRDPGAGSPLPGGLALLRTATYGDTVLHYLTMGEGAATQ